MKSAVEIFGVKNSAIKAYVETNITSQKDFEEDYQRFMLAKKLASRIHAGRSNNIRLLCNHLVCITNVFDVQGAKDILRHLCGEELSTIKTVLTYLNFLDVHEWNDASHCILTAKLLKEMDR